MKTMWWGLAVLVLLSCFFSPSAGAPGELHEAAVNGNLTTLKELVSKIAPSDLQSALTQCYQKPSGPSACFDSSGTAQGYACPQLDSNVDDCISVLQAAAIGRQPAVVQYLLTDLKAQPDWKNGAKKTALHYAFDSFSVYWHPCDEDFRKTVLALLAGGADPNIPFPYGGLENYTVLHFEAYDGNRHSLVPALIKYGAKVNAADERGLTPLHSAAKCDFRLSCDDCGCSDNFCTGGSPKDVPCPSDINAYSETLEFFGAAETLKYLVGKGGDPKALTKDGTSVIDYVQVPDDKSVAEWPSGTCKATYMYLRSLGLTPSPAPAPSPSP